MTVTRHPQDNGGSWAWALDLFRLLLAAHLALMPWLFPILPAQSSPMSVELGYSCHPSHWEDAPLVPFCP